MSDSQAHHVLSQGVGYGIVIGLGLAFSLIMVSFSVVEIQLPRRESADSIRHLA
jgi:hypothetical protein